MEDESTAREASIHSDGEAETNSTTSTDQEVLNRNNEYIVSRTEGSTQLQDISHLDTSQDEKTENILKPKVNASLASLDSRGSRNEVCRICHDGGQTEGFISPCYCKGSMSLVHRSCLERWLAESDSNLCELCGYVFTVRRLPKYSLFHSLGVWMTSSSTWRQRKTLLVDLVAMILICPAVVISSMFALQMVENVLQDDFLVAEQQRTDPNGLLEEEEGLEVRRDGPHGATTYRQFQGTYQLLGDMLSSLGQMGIISLIVTMDMAYISWVLVKLQYHVASWYFWHRRNCKVMLLLTEQPPGHEAGQEIQTGDPIESQ